jgi:hypothetical protein
MARTTDPQGPSYNHITAGSVDPGVVFQDANSFLAASPSNDFSFDYTELATEMSDYITWNAADLTPWMNFHPYQATEDPENLVPYNNSGLSGSG